LVRRFVPDTVGVGLRLIYAHHTFAADLFVYLHTRCCVTFAVGGCLRCVALGCCGLIYVCYALRLRYVVHVARTLVRYDLRYVVVVDCC